MISMSIFVILIAIIEETVSQKGCSNPVTKLYETLQTFGTAAKYNQTYPECARLVDSNCCHEVQGFLI